MPRPAIVELRIFPDDCDAYGHVNQAAFLRLFERARWELLANGPGSDVFTREGAWPAIRRAAVEYYAPAFPGDLLAFDIALTHLGRTSMSMHQVVRRSRDNALVAAGHFVAVCIDQQGRPVPVPEAAREFFGVRPAIPCDNVRQFIVHNGTITLESEGDGDPVLFIHGFPLDRTMWRSQVSGLRGWGRIAPDLRGFGLSDRPTGAWQLAEHADDLVALLDQLGVGSVVLCALSMGGYVALEMARRHPGRVRALILSNTRAEADSADGRRQRDQTSAAVRARGTAALVESMLPKLVSPRTAKEQPAVVAHVRSMIEETGVEGALAAFTVLRDRKDSTDLLSSINVPTLIIAGEEDAIIPVDVQRGLTRIPGAILEVIPGAGHLTPLEKPDAFNRVVSSFLNSIR